MIFICPSNHTHTKKLCNILTSHISIHHHLTITSQTSIDPPPPQRYSLTNVAKSKQIVLDINGSRNVESLVEQLKSRPKCFFILTNSRALSSDKASLLITDICQNLSTASKAAGNNDYTVVLRGDSTLRGHFPEEPDAAVSVLGEMDAWIICPFFLQGGRYTIDDVHYVADSEQLVPAGDTEFAKDASFGYKSSNLREWVEEKTKGRIAATSVSSVSIQLLRNGGPTAVCDHLCSLPKGSTCIVNAASDRDMAVFAAGMVEAELKGKRFLCRTAASFVSARIRIIPKAHFYL